MTVSRTIRAALGRFARDERGAVAYLMMVGMTTVTLMVFLIVNTGNGLHDRTRAQDAADALAMTHAVEGARSLNVMSMNNVALTQGFAVGTISAALRNTMNEFNIKAAAAGVEIAASALYCPKIAKKAIIPKVAAAVAAACLSHVGIMELRLGIFVMRMNSIRNRYDPDRAFDVADKTIRALNAMNDTLVKRYPDAVRAAAMPVARAARMSDFYFDEPCQPGSGSSCKGGKSRQGMDLPVEQNDGLESKLQFCAGATLGTMVTRTTYSKRGFASGTGPLARNAYTDPYLRDSVNEKTGIGKVLEGYYEYFDETEMICPKLNPWDFLWIWGKWGKCPKVTKPLGNYYQEQKEDDNRFTLLADVMFAKFCEPTGALAAAGNAIPGINLLLRGTTDPVLYHPKNLSLRTAVPFPPVNEIDDAYKPMSMTFRRQSKRWAPEILHEPMEGAVSYAQALIYNADGLDIYSQNWTARLMPATRMDDLPGVRERMRTRAPDAFDQIRRRFHAVSDLNSWKTMNVK